MKLKAYLYVIIGASLWGLIGIFVKALNAQGFNSLQIVALRTSTAAIFTTLLLARMGSSYFKINLRDLWMFLGTGIVSMTFFNFCYFNCIQQSSLAVAALLLYTAPIFVMLMSIVLFKERFTALKGVALAATFVGCACVTGIFSGQLSLSLGGLLYGLGSGLGYAAYSIFGKFALRKYSSETITAYTFYIAALTTIPMADFASSFTPAMINWHTLFGILGLSLVCAVVPYILYTRGLEQVEASQASIIATIEPFVAATVGVLLFSEPITMQKALGMLLILGSIVLLNLKKE